MNRILALVRLAVPLGLLAGCSKQVENTADPATRSPARSTVPTVYTTFHPIFEFTRRIGGDSIKVVNPCPGDEDPALWRPSPEVIADYQQADLIVMNGANFEKWVPRATLPESRLVDTAKALAGEILVIKEAAAHSHGPGGEKHSHAGLDPHTWVDPIHAKRQARVIVDAMNKRWPESKDAFEAGYAALSAEFDVLDSELRRLTEKYDGQTLLASHPSYNYLAKRYGWKVESLELTPEVALDAETLERIRESVKTNSAKFMVWEAEPLAATKELLKRELGLTSVIFDPGEGISEDELKSGENYFTVMKQNLQNLSTVFTRNGSPASTKPSAP